MSENEKIDEIAVEEQERMKLKKEEWEKQKAEYEKKKREETIAMIRRQTDYDEEMAKRKLKEWNNNYINVIKEFINPDINVPKNVKKQPKSVNQNVMGEIRYFMDNVNKQYQYRKSIAEMQQKRRAHCILVCKKKLEKEIQKVKEKWSDVPDECWQNIEVQKLLLGHRGNNPAEVLYGKTFCDFYFEKK